MVNNNSFLDNEAFVFAHSADPSQKKTYILKAALQTKSWGYHYLKFNNSDSPNYKIRTKNWWNHNKDGVLFVPLKVQGQDGKTTIFEIKVESLIRRLYLSHNAEEIVAKAQEGKLEELVDTQLRELRNIEADVQQCYDRIIANYSYDKLDDELHIKSENIPIGLTAKDLKKVIRKGFLIPNDPSGKPSTDVVTVGNHSVAVERNDHSLKLVSVSSAKAYQDSTFSHIKAVIDISGAEIALAKTPLDIGKNANASNKFIENEGAIVSSIYKSIRSVVGIQEPVFLCSWKGQNAFFQRKYDGDLSQIIGGEKVPQLGPALKGYKEIQISMIDQLLEGLVILQKLQIAHLDIKPPNILVKWDKKKRFYKFVLADFGFASNIRKLYEKSDAFLWPHCHGTTGYLRITDEDALRNAKTYEEYRGLLHKRDVYATGLSIIQAVCLLDNTKPLNRTQALLALKNSNLIEEIKDILTAMIQDNPAKRPSPITLQKKWNKLKAGQSDFDVSTINFHSPHRIDSAGISSMLEKEIRKQKHAKDTRAKDTIVTHQIL